MESNIFKSYENYEAQSIHKFLKLLLDMVYDSKIADLFVAEYLKVRYQQADLDYQTDMALLLHDHLMEFAMELVKKNQDVDVIKNTFNAFQFVLCLDGVLVYDDKKLIEQMKTARMEYGVSKELPDHILDYFKEVDQKKQAFFKLLSSPCFSLKVQKCTDLLHYYYASLKQEVKVSKLYSEYAISKVYHNGVIAEDSFYVLLTMVAGEILNAIMMNDDVKRYYLIDFPSSMLEKKMKMARFQKMIDHPILMDRMVYQLTYQAYLENKDIVNSLIKEGIMFAVVMDEHYDVTQHHYSSLLLFRQIFVNRELSYFTELEAYKSDLPLVIQG